LTLRDDGRNGVPADVRLALLLKAAWRAYGFKNIGLREVKQDHTTAGVLPAANREPLTKG
jgi:hypothetical protein